MGLIFDDDERVRQIARHAGGGASQVVQPEGVNGHNGARPKSRVLRCGPFVRCGQYTTRSGPGRGGRIRLQAAGDNLQARQAAKAVSEDLVRRGHE